MSNIKLNDELREKLLTAIHSLLESTLNAEEGESEIDDNHDMGAETQAKSPVKTES
jgi:hypothetical protein